MTVNRQELWLNRERIACDRGQPDRVEVRDREGYVPVHFNHLAVAAKDKQRSATFLKDLLGLEEPTSWGPVPQPHARRRDPIRLRRTRR